jgi:hypothetical protein
VDAPRLRPHAYLLRRAFTAAIAFFTPVLGILYYLTIPDGAWLAVLVAQIVLTVAVTYCYVSYLLVAVWVTADTVTERGFFGRTQRFHRSELGSIVLANAYRSDGAETVPQLFITDPDGRQLIRLRGQFWSRDTMQTIMSTLDMPVTEIDDPVTNSELHASYPGLLYWFERRPVMAAVAFAAILIGGGGALYAILVALGTTAR